MDECSWLSHISKSQFFLAKLKSAYLLKIKVLVFFCLGFSIRFLFVLFCFLLCYLGFSSLHQVLSDYIIALGKYFYRNPECSNDCDSYALLLDSFPSVDLSCPILM